MKYLSLTHTNMLFLYNSFCVIIQCIQTAVLGMHRTARMQQVCDELQVYEILLHFSNNESLHTLPHQRISVTYFLVFTSL